MTRRLDRFAAFLQRLGELTNPEQFSHTELWLISFWIMCLAILAALVLLQPHVRP